MVKKKKKRKEYGENIGRIKEIRNSLILEWK